MHQSMRPVAHTMKGWFSGLEEGAGEKQRIYALVQQYPESVSENDGWRHLLYEGEEVAMCDR